jgi:hypothetical protein
MSKVTNIVIALLLKFFIYYEMSYNIKDPIHEKKSA